jgi:hypothetical protein
LLRLSHLTVNAIVASIRAGGVRLSRVFVDWANVRLSLACARHRAGPQWVLRALVDAVRGTAARDPADAELELELYLIPQAEHRADRVLLRTGVGRPDVTVREHAAHGDLTGIALALDAADAWHQGAKVAIVSDDGELAYVVRHYAAARPGRGICLLHVHDKPPGSRAGPMPPGTTQHLRLALDDRVDRRRWTDWDVAAWALRRLAGFTADTIAERVLQPGAGQTHHDLWRKTDVTAVGGWKLLERADHLVADLWRLGWGRPFGRDEAQAEVERRLGVRGGDAWTVLDALLVAQLLRWHDRDRLEVPSGWREGLLLPARRTVLRLARQPDLTHPVDRLEHRHRRRFGPHPGAPGVPALEHASRADSWRWVKHALRDRLRAVVEKTERRPGRPPARATWTLAHERFALETIETAERIRGLLAAPLKTSELEARIEAQPEAQPVWRLGRWLRCLRDAGLVYERNGRWASAPRTTLNRPERGD